MALFDDWDWGKIAQGLIASIPGTVASVAGANQVSDANQQAANLALVNAAQNRDVLSQATERGLGFLRPQLEAGAPATAYLRTVMAGDPYSLTPAQKIDLADRRQRVLAGMSPGLRGSGRYVAAALGDVENRGRAGMIDANIARADQAARTLNAQGANAGASSANLSTQLGPAIAGQNTLATDTAGNAVTGTAASNAQTMGDIASFFANAVKEGTRDSRYRDFRKNLEG